MFEKGNKLGKGRPVGSKNKPDPNKAAVKSWHDADLVYKYRPIQVRINEQFLAAKGKSRKFVLNCSRRLGKSTWMFMKCVEACLSEPDVEIAFVAPVQKNLNQYLKKITRKVFNDCPEEKKPTFNVQQTFYEFPNGSVLYVAGANRESYNQLRGYGLKRAAIDEGAQVQSLKELIKDVLLPALLDSNGDLLIGSTPPVTPDHYFKELCEEAKLGGYYAEYTIYDAGYPPERIEEWKRETIKKPSDLTTWQREYLAMFVVDAERALCPEWKPEFVQEWKRDSVLFPFYIKWMALDTGARDKTVGLFSYYDFKAAKLIIEDEFSLQGTEVRTDVIAAQGKEHEKFLEYTDITRYADNDNLILIQDLTSFHEYPIQSVSKDSLEAMVNQVRLLVNEGRVIVHPRCKLLIATLEGGIWNTHRTEFDRTENLGHMDAFAALMYMVRTINMTMNPIPAHLGVNHYTHHIQNVDPHEDIKSQWNKMLNLNQRDEFEDM
jgi:hypothetical protein